MTQTDLRDENFSRFGSALARIGPSPVVPSPNLKRMIEALETGELAPIVRLGERIEAGAATDEEEEVDKVYDAVPLLLAYVQDLVDMCRRREQALKECDVGIGFKLD
jgi:hypothetical protein